MKDFFSPDNPLMIQLTKIAFTVWLNLLWFICSIPVFTIGASTTALFTVTLKMAKNEEGSVTYGFFKAFKENFRFSTKVWLILLALGVVLGVDGYVLYHLRYENAFWTILAAALVVVFIAYGIILMYIFPLMAHFENTVFAMLKNSLFIGIRFLFCTVLMAAIYFFMLLIIVRFFTPAFIFGEGLCAYLCSYLLGGVLKQCEGSDGEETENPGEQN
ncbi:MAG: DUF624 domain-containing protein [Blautia sp.]|nr:DUF624 domain-containing protein [Blautia sp.]